MSIPVIREALADAIEHRRLPDWCGDCSASDLLCDTHEADVQQARRYAAALEHLRAGEAA